MKTKYIDTNCKIFPMGMVDDNVINLRYVGYKDEIIASALAAGFRIISDLEKCVTQTEHYDDQCKAIVLDTLDGDCKAVLLDEANWQVGQKLNVAMGRTGGKAVKVLHTGMTAEVNGLQYEYDDVRGQFREMTPKINITRRVPVAIVELISNGETTAICYWHGRPRGMYHPSIQNCREWEMIFDNSDLTPYLTKIADEALVEK